MFSIMADLSHIWGLLSTKQFPEAGQFLMALSISRLAALGLIVFLALFTVYINIIRVKNWYRLRHFKGPFGSGWSYFYFVWTSLSFKSFRVHLHTQRKYGKLIRMGPNELCTSDVDLIKAMSHPRATGWSRSGWYDFGRVHPTENTILNIRDNTTHDQARHTLVSAYSGRANDDLERDIDSQLINLVHNLKTNHLSSPGHIKPVEFVRMSQYFTVDTISKVCFGKPFGYLNSNSDSKGLLEIVERFAFWSEITANIPLTRSILACAPLFFTLGLHLAIAIGDFNRLGQGIIRERFEDMKKYDDPKGKYGDMVDAFVKKGLSQRNCELHIPVQLTAGTETTATAIRNTVLRIITTPPVYRRLRQEIDSAIAEGRITTTPVSFTEAKAIPYMGALLSEGLRIHPPFSGMVMKQAPLEGYTYKDGRFIPGGTYVGHNTWAAMRDPEVFGDDVDVFRPERFLEGGEDQQRFRRSYVDLVFGSGRFQCMGRAISIMELHKVFIELFRNFDIQVIDCYNPMKTRNVLVFQQKDMYVRVTERDDKAVPGSAIKTE